MIHEMKLQPEPFKQIRKGIKTIEVRLNDEKRQRIRVGDQIIFSMIRNPKQIVRTEVLNLYHFDKFKDLFEALPISNFGAINKGGLLSIYDYYTEDQEEKFGVLGIKIKII